MRVFAECGNTQRQTDTLRKHYWMLIQNRMNRITKNPTRIWPCVVFGLKTNKQTRHKKIIMDINVDWEKFFYSGFPLPIQASIFLCWMLCIIGQKVSNKSLMAALSDCSPSSSCLLLREYFTIRLWAGDFYESILDEAEGQINYHLIKIESE